jgi:predicted short-subunit dehydrogenase-like oxidoreductase (DUF2520 family)
MTASVPDLTLIVGAGRVGSSLAMALDNAGWPVGAIGGRNAAHCAQLAGSLRGVVQGASMESLQGPFGVVILAVPDDAIGEVGASLLPLDLVGGESVVLHVSGVHSGDILRPLTESGVAVGSMHPLQTFADAATGLRVLPGTHWFIEGDPRALHVARRMLALVSGITHDIPAHGKVLYHASAAIACNFLGALLDAALEVVDAAGLDRDEMVPALQPLLQATLDNALEKGPRSAMTGPISRGDAATVRLHLEALEQVDELATLYRTLGRRVLTMAVASGRLKEPEISRLQMLLGDEDAMR